MEIELNNVKLAIFDIDGTLTEIKPEVLARKPRMVSPNNLGEQQSKPRVVEKLAELRQNGMNIALATNRGGVAWGYSTLEEAEALAREAAEICGVPDVKVYVCPYHAKARGPKAVRKYAIDHDCRKPNPGMLLEAMEDAGVTPDETLFVGDYETDEQAAENAGVRFYWAEEFFGGRDQ
jgi:D-glycero-D-manno-heptose 1,7-bisphosphate phosphatase